MNGHWRFLEAHADRQDVQKIIGEEIRKGTIRVRPAPRGGIRIIPAVPSVGEEADCRRVTISERPRTAPVRSRRSLAKIPQMRRVPHLR